MDAIEHCQRIIEQHSKSFALASKLLPSRCRANAVIVYAWCRRADDAVDRPTGDPPEALARLKQELDDIYARRPTNDLVLDAFAQVARECAIPRIYPEELLAGMAMDLEPRRYETIDNLLLYCHRVAGVVGLMMSHVLGVSNDRALLHAAHLGIAMQLTNICRDVEEDWQRGRCYLPLPAAEWNSLHAVDHARREKLSVEFCDRLKKPIRELIALSDRFYASGDLGIPYLDTRSAWAIRTARLVYSGINRAVERQGCDPAAGRAFVSSGRKLAFLARSIGPSMMQGLRRATPAATVRPPREILQYPEAARLTSDPR